MSKKLTTRQAAARLSIRQKEVLHRVQNGDIKAEKLDWIWVIDEDEIKRIRQTEWYKKYSVRTS